MGQHPVTLPSGVTTGFLNSVACIPIQIFFFCFKHISKNKFCISTSVNTSKDRQGCDQVIY